MKCEIFWNEKLPGFEARTKEGLAGILIYGVSNNSCKIVSLDSMVENHGIGSHLLKHAVGKARELGCKRVWATVTNDNIRSIRFFQKRGFTMAAIHKNSVEEARKLSPGIPMYGYDDIPILHEIEVEMVL